MEVDGDSDLRQNIENVVSWLALAVYVHWAR